MMNNALNTQYYEHQSQSRHQIQPCSTSSSAPVTYQQQIPSYIHHATSSNSSFTMKRGRVSSEESSASLPSSTCGTASQHLIHTANLGGPSSTQAPISSTPKKARPNAYEVPRSVKPSLLTAMGTLARGNLNKNGFGSFLAESVPMRRRLSGGHLDQYIWEHHTSLDTDPTRPRSMSF